MKSFITAFAILCVAIAGGTIYLNLRKPSSVPAQAAEPSSGQRAAPVKTTAAENPAPMQRNPASSNRPTPRFLATLAANAPKSADSSEATAFNRAIDSLVSPTTSFQDKRAMWARLREAGQLDQAIETLKQGATNNPTSPEYQAALGTALLQKAGEVSRNGGAMNELAILGMSADQSFDAALKIDPANWDAQFYKAVSMSYWPAELNKGAEVVQRFSTLIDQQETMAAQPQFANTYVLLGEQFKKMGQPDNAQQTWQLGAAKFPNDPVLQKKISGK